MDIGVELLCVLAGVEALEAVLLERRHEDAVRHLEAVVQRREVLVIGELGRLDIDQRAVEVVDGFDEVAGEFLQGEVLCGADLALGALLEVAVVGDGAEVFVLFGEGRLVIISSHRRHAVGSDWEACVGDGKRTLRSRTSLSFFSNCSFNCAVASSLGASDGASLASAAGAASEYHLMADGVAVRTAACWRMGAKAAGCILCTGRAAFAARKTVL